MDQEKKTTKACKIEANVGHQLISLNEIMRMNHEILAKARIPTVLKCGENFKKEIERTFTKFVRSEFSEDRPFVNLRFNGVRVEEDRTMNPDNALMLDQNDVVMEFYQLGEK